MPTIGCFECNRQFGSIFSLEQHCSDTRHDLGCRPCQRRFAFVEALQQHMQDSPAHNADSSNSDDDYEWSDDSDKSSEEDDTFCAGCNRWFVDTESLHQHLLNNSKHNWCFPCSRDFGSPTALNQHIASPVHKGRAFDCLFCDRAFKTPSAIAMHIESGCHKISRQQVTAAVHKLKIIPTISVDRRLKGPVSPPTTTITYSATQLAFNGFGYECYLCHRTFSTLGRLNAHLNSPAHDADEFKCPKCKSEFKLVSGLIQHIESAACGLAKFKDVQSQFEDLTARFSRALKFS